MSIYEVHGGPVTRRYLMNKSKDDLVGMYMDAVLFVDRLTADRDAATLLRKYATRDRDNYKRLTVWAMSLLCSAYEVGNFPNEVVDFLNDARAALREENKT